MTRPFSFSRTCPASKGSIMPCCSDIRRIHLSDLMLMVNSRFQLVGKLGRSLPCPLVAVEVLESGSRSLPPLVLGRSRDGFQIPEKPLLTAHSSGLKYRNTGDSPAEIALPRGQLCTYPSGNIAIPPRHFRIRFGHHRGLTAVGLFADGHVQGQLAQQDGFVFFRDAFAAAVAEEGFFVAAVGADVHAHVFDHADDRDVDFAEHFDAFFTVQQGDVLRGGDDDGAGYRDFLAQGELDVAGAGGHVYDEVVELIPQGLLEQLHDGAADHRAAPGHGGFVSGDEGHGVGLQAVGGDGYEVFVFAHVRALAFGDAEHHADAGAVDVGIQDSNPGTFGVQGQGEVDGGGGFAHAAFARGNGDDVFHARYGGDVFVDLAGVDFLGHVDFCAFNAAYKFEGVGDDLFQAAGDAF